MTHIIKKPQLAILGEFDGTAYTGTLYDRNSNTVTGVAMTDNAPHFDLIAFLNGYGTKSGKDLNSDFASNKPSTFTSFVGAINESGHFYIDSSHAFSFHSGFEDNRAKLGFTGSESATYSSDASAYRMTATNTFKRGVFEITKNTGTPRLGLAFVNTATSGVFDALPNERRAQNLPTFLRVRGSVGDADDVYSGKCLEDWESTAGNTDATFVLEEDGRVSVNYPSNDTDHAVLANITTKGESLLLRLGFDGTETQVTTSGNHAQLRATNRAPCVLPTGRGYVELRREVLSRDDHSIMADGSVISAGLSPIKGWAVVLRVFGPAHGYSKDQEKHLRNWWQHARRGLTIYPSFGDPDNAGDGGNDTRRHVDLIGLYGTTARHNLSQTVEADESPTHHGKRVGGRLLLRRHPADQQERREAYSGALDIHQDIRLRLLDDPSR
jgi:hypothetical protein